MVIGGVPIGIVLYVISSIWSIQVTYAGVYMIPVSDICPHVDVIFILIAVKDLHIDVFFSEPSVAVVLHSIIAGYPLVGVVKFSTNRRRSISPFCETIRTTISVGNSSITMTITRSRSSDPPVGFHMKKISIGLSLWLAYIEAPYNHFKLFYQAHLTANWFPMGKH